MDCVAVEEVDLPVVSFCSFSHCVGAELRDHRRGIDVIVPIEPQLVRENVFFWLRAMESTEQKS